MRLTLPRRACHGRKIRQASPHAHPPRGEGSRAYFKEFVLTAGADAVAGRVVVGGRRARQEQRHPQQRPLSGRAISHLKRRLQST
jgi:hypothetical protein